MFHTCHKVGRNSACEHLLLTNSGSFDPFRRDLHKKIIIQLKDAIFDPKDPNPILRTILSIRCYKILCLVSTCMIQISLICYCKLRICYCYLFFLILPSILLDLDRINTEKNYLDTYWNIFQILWYLFNIGKLHDRLIKLYF